MFKFHPFGLKKCFSSPKTKFKHTSKQVELNEQHFYWNYPYLLRKIYFMTAIKQFYVSCFILFIAFSSIAQSKGHKIEITVDNFQEKQLYFAVHYGNKQYIKDTLDITAEGTFIKQGEEPLKQGIYLAILPPDNNYFELLVGSDDEQFFSAKTSTENFVTNMQVKGTKENERFYEYLIYMGNQRKKADELRKELEEVKENAGKSKKITDKIDAIDEEVEAYQADFMTKYAGSLGAAMIKASKDVPIPDPKEKLDKKAMQEYQFRYYREHFFDHIDFSDHRLVHTPILHSKMERFLDKLTYQVPDSINVSVDYLLDKCKANEDVFQYAVVYCLNKYAQAKIIGFDAVYVHIAEKYYGGGLADWTEEDQLKKILKNARTLKPLLIGKKAPNIKIHTIDDQPIQLYDVESEFTIVYFWDPDCGHCKKSAPKMVKFYDDYKAKGITLFSICTKDKEKEKCVNTIEEKDLGRWLNTMAQEDQELYYRLNYNIRSTPVLYVLDKDKTIISKNLGADQLPEVMDRLMEMQDLK